MEVTEIIYFPEKQENRICTQDHIESSDNVKIRLNNFYKPWENIEFDKKNNSYTLYLPRGYYTEFGNPIIDQVIELYETDSPNPKVIEFFEILEAYHRKFNTVVGFAKALQTYKQAPIFKINENIFEQDYKWTDEAHFIMRYKTGKLIEESFRAMKIDLSDPNVMSDLETGNIGTAQRIAKMWCGASTTDDRELMSGRWSKPPRMATFPNNNKIKHRITKRVDLTAVCSHHAAPFSSTFREDAYAIISYVPEDNVLGISKLQRIVDWVGQRGWLQEELTEEIYKKVSEAAGTENVYVRLNNIVHTCESIRGAKSKDGCFTSERYGGLYNDEEFRKDL